jgi:hypothetical protein
VRAGLELVAAVGALTTHATLQTRVGIATVLKRKAPGSAGPWRFPSLLRQWGDRPLESSCRARRPNDA